MEEGLFPNARSVEESGRLEEERRLAYVGITRARQKLVLSYAESRRLNGQDMYGVPSRFLREIPAALLHEVRPKVQVSRPMYAIAPPPNPALPVADGTPGIPLGQNVTPPSSGSGTATAIEAAAPPAGCRANFTTVGRTWRALASAN